jgi:predicted transposase/invertase (TIGR01784 family)
MSNLKKTPHDDLFKKIFKNRENAGDLLSVVLPQNIIARMDMESVYVEDVSYLDENLAKHFSDLVLSLDLKNSRTQVKVYCLLEHKSSPYQLVGLQLLRYMALQWTDLVDNKKIVGTKLPPIIPIVIYQGGQTWKVFNSFHDLIEFPSEEFKAYTPDFEFVFFDIPGVDKNRLQKIQNRCVLHFYLALLKTLHSPELKEILPDLIEGLCKTLNSRTVMDYIGIFYRYILRTTDSVTRKDMQHALNILPQGGEYIMNTLAEEWQKEGEQRGIIIGEQRGEQRGELKTVRQLLLVTLQDRFDLLPQFVINDIKSIESPETLNELFRKTLRCESLDQFKGWLNKVLGQTAH